MEMGTLDERRQAEVDALYAQAKQALAQGANHLRDITERLRQIHAAGLVAYEAQASGDLGVGDRRLRPSDLGRDQSLLARLEVALRDMEQSWLFLERGLTGAWVSTGRGSADERDLPGDSDGVSAMQILEAQEAERAFVAEELHDGPAQALSNAVFQVDIIDRTMVTDPPTAHVELRALRGKLERELETIRALIHQLHPSLPAEGGLETALGELGQQLRDEVGLYVEVRLEAASNLLDDAQRAAVLRVAQEATRNVRKHAVASSVRIFTFLEPDSSAPQAERWVLEVADDGLGFAVNEVVDRASRRHFGLRFMRERAQLIGARLDIVSEPGAGATVRLALEPQQRS